MSNSLQPHGLQHARLPCPSPTPGVCSNSCPSSRWCIPAITSSVVPFSSCLQYFPGSFQMSQLFSSGGQILEFHLQHPVNIQDWFPCINFSLNIPFYVYHKCSKILSLVLSIKYFWFSSYIPIHSYYFIFIFIWHKKVRFYLSNTTEIFSYAFII